MIDVINLTKRYEEFTAVNQISFQVKEGETLALIGTSGCGKTTTLKMLNRLIEPTEGEIYIGGKDVRNSKPDQLRQSIGYVIQNVGLFPHYTVADNIAVVPRLLKWKEKRIANRTQELLELVGLAPNIFAQRYPHELSGGQRQRVGFARALAADPPIILLDEPFGALDQITRAQIQKEFKQLESLIHKTMALVTHDIFEAVELCDRICVMDKGILQQEGSPKELIFNPKNEFVKAFFQSNRFELELKVVTLKDVVPELKPLSENEERANEKNIKEYSEKTSIFEVLETIAESSDHPLVAIINEKGEKEILTRSDALFQAFYQVKESLYS